MTADLSGPDLNRAIAEAMGWRGLVLRGHAAGRAWWGDLPRRTVRAGKYPVPDFERSLDAQRDGPWKMLHEAGYLMGQAQYVVNAPPLVRYQYWWAGWRYTQTRIGDRAGEEDARTAALSTLAALLAMNAAKEVVHG